MYSLNDIAGASTKIKTPENKTNNNQTISISETSVVRVEISEPLCKTVRHQTISLPRDSIYEVRSRGKITTEEDVLNIKISNVQGATADQAKNKVLLNQKENGQKDTDKLSNQQMQSAFHVARQREIPLVKRFRSGQLMNVNQIAKHVDKSGGKRSRCEVDLQTKFPYTERFPGRRLSKDMITEKKRYQVDSDVPCSVNQSSILNGEPLTATTGIRKKLAPQINSREPEIFSSYHLSPQPPALTQPSNYLQSSAYQMSTNGSISAYHVNSAKALYTHPQNGDPVSVSSHQASASVTPPCFHMSSNGTVPLHHMEEITTAQAQDGQKNTSHQANYHPGMSKYYDYNSFNDFQQGMLFWPTEKHSMVPNRHLIACSCSCSCYAQSESHHYDAFNPKNQRPSVIMVPVSWSSGDSGRSHLPLKVDATTYKLHSDEHLSNRESVADRMEYAMDSDSSDDDGENGKEKYFRQNIDGATARFKLTKEEWERIPIKTFPSGGRLLSGDWTRIFLSKVKESNPWCSLRFKNNHVRSENSRKIHSAVFFRGGAECKRPECNVKVRFVIRKEKGKHVDVTYVGDVCHNSQPGVNDVTSDDKTINRFRRNYST
ncbi:uncharacterized protein LOC110050829 isoform X2 [Orbicella faveolata]|uniref:uncharacterized protein LOC110050829 isoform X2 n=1 Tax=Orbicella faveolata TaxID=48498 RepID=UPI0009E3D739|nr:uncharacterized protein LOC110050829 isoform X2 [Orbicella faveolata]